MLIEHIAESLETKNICSIALSGGSIPRRLYALLADDQRLRKQIPWKQIHFFWGDERRVPPDHPDSNYRMAHEARLSKVPIPPANWIEKFNAFRITLTLPVLNSADQA